MASEKRAVIERWFEEVWNQGKLDAMPEMMAEDAIVHGLPVEGAGGPCGPAKFRPFVEQFRSAFPDMHFVVEDVIEEGDKIVARCSVSGTHQGETLGVASTNKPIAISGITIARIRDGKIVEGWNNYDMMGLFHQIGAIQPPGG